MKLCSRSLVNIKHNKHRTNSSISLAQARNPRLGERALLLRWQVLA